MTLRKLAALQSLLMSPALFFMGALILRAARPLEYEPAQTANRIVMLYAGKQWTLWVLLVAFPIAVLVSGAVILRRGWHTDAAASASRSGTNGFIAAMTLSAAAVLAVVIVHMLAN